MKYLIIPIFLGWCLFSSHYYVCEILGECEPKPVVTAPLDSTRMAGLGLMENGKMAFAGDYNHFRFAKDSNEPDLNENNEEFLTAVATYMKENPDNTLKLTGYYLPEEESPDSYGNMGISRAAKIRDLLVERGISEDRFDVRGEVLEKDAILDKPIAFDVIVPVKVEEGKKEEDKVVYATSKQTFEDRVYYFAFGSADFTPDQPFITYVEELKTYFKEEGNKDKKVSIIGHTDDVGTPAANMKLGQNRANEIKKYMVAKGISKKTISTSSMGESQPAGPNDTPENQAKNRRVNVKID